MDRAWSIDQIAGMQAAVTTIQRKSDDERVDFFLAARLDGDGRSPTNGEPDKCSEFVWSSLSAIPDDTIPYVRTAIETFRRGGWFQEFGWT